MSACVRNLRCVESVSEQIYPLSVSELCRRKKGGGGGLDEAIWSNYEMGMIDRIFGSKSRNPDFSDFFRS